MRIELPDPVVVALIGASGCGKSTFARRHFAPDEIFSSDAWRRALSGREANQGISREAFAGLYAAARERLASGGSVIVDATNLDIQARGEALDLAAGAGVPAVAIVLDLPLEECLARNALRPDRQVAAGVIRRQHRFLQRTLPFLGREGFDAVHVISGTDALTTVEVGRGAPSD